MVAADAKGERAKTATHRMTVTLAVAPDDEASDLLMVTWVEAAASRWTACGKGGARWRGGGSGSADRRSQQPVQGSYGTGVLIAPGLVLTAHHVALPGRDSVVTVRDTASVGFTGAAVVWENAELDAVLLQADRTCVGAGMGVVRWGELVCDYPGRRPVCSMTGFPNAMRRRVSARSEQYLDDLKTVEGTIAPHTGSRSKLYALEVDGAVPTDVKNWQGLSGHRPHWCERTRPTHRAVVQGHRPHRRRRRDRPGRNRQIPPRPRTCRGNDVVVQRRTAVAESASERLGQADAVAILVHQHDGHAERVGMVQLHRGEGVARSSTHLPEDSYACCGPRAAASSATTRLSSGFPVSARAFGSSLGAREAGLVDTSDDQPHPCHGPAHDGHRLRHPARQSLVESTCPKAPHSPLSAAQHRCRLGVRA